MELHVAGIRILVRQLAEVGVAAAVLGQPVLEVGVVGAYLNVGTCFIEEYLGGLISLFHACSHYAPSIAADREAVAFCGYFLRLMSSRITEFANRKSSDDAYPVRACAVG